MPDGMAEEVRQSAPGLDFIARQIDTGSELETEAEDR